MEAYTVYKHEQVSKEWEREQKENFVMSRQVEGTFAASKTKGFVVA